MLSIELCALWLQGWQYMSSQVASLPHHPGYPGLSGPCPALQVCLERLQRSHQTSPVDMIEPLELYFSIRHVLSTAVEEIYELEVCPVYL